MVQLQNKEHSKTLTFDSVIVEFHLAISEKRRVVMWTTSLTLALIVA